MGQSINQETNNASKKAFIQTLKEIIQKYCVTYAQEKRLTKTHAGRNPSLKN